jgi:hypothetical protein
MRCVSFRLLSLSTLFRLIHFVINDIILLFVLFIFVRQGLSE